MDNRLHRFLSIKNHASFNIGIYMSVCCCVPSNVFNLSSLFVYVFLVKLEHTPMDTRVIRYPISPMGMTILSKIHPGYGGCWVSNILHGYGGYRISNILFVYYGFLIRCPPYPQGILNIECPPYPISHISIW